jgi:hypothetical protein
MRTADLLAMLPVEKRAAALALADVAFQTRAEARASESSSAVPIVRPARSVKAHGGTTAADALPFSRICELAHLPVPVPEFRFHPSRRWRFDWAWPAHRLALEVEGGIRDNGRHTRPLGFLADMVKYNQAAALGWRLLRCTPGTLTRDATLSLVRKALDV